MKKSMIFKSSLILLLFLFSSHLIANAQVATPNGDSTGAQFDSYEEAANQAIHNQFSSLSLKSGEVSADFNSLQIIDSLLQNSLTVQAVKNADSSTTLIFENYTTELYINGHIYHGNQLNHFDNGQQVFILSQTSPSQTERFEIRVEISQDQKTVKSVFANFQQFTDVNSGTVVNPVETKQWANGPLSLTVNK